MVMSIRSLPLGGIVKFERDIDDLFDTFFGSSQILGSYTRLNVQKYADRTEIVGELPGIRKEDLSITFNDGTLLVKGERKPQALPDGASWISNEIPAGEFSRSIRLPHDVKIDGISAELSDGLLHIVLPKSEKALPKQVVIR